MLDIQFIKENRAVVEKAINDKKGEEVDIDKLLSLYEERTKLRGEVSRINEKRNTAAKERNIEAGRRLKEEGQQLEAELREVEKAFVALMIKIPNVPSPDTPVGPDELGNKVLRTWPASSADGSKPKKFSFKPKEHWELGAELGIIDTETAAEISGSRFVYLKGDAVLLQFALIQHTLAVLKDTEQLEQIAEKAGVKVNVTPFIPIVPPVMMKSAIMNMMGRLHPLDERYYFEKDDLVLVGSAEHTLGPMHLQHTFAEGELPLRYIGYSTSFRREAGTYGKDTKGILRLHQFDKLEMETFVLPEHGLAEQDFMVAIQEHLMQSLGIPYRVVIICTGDMSAPDQRQIDIEAWLPGHPSTDGSGRGAYRETHTSDYMGGFQARRLSTKVRRTDNKTEHVHMNDATAFAIGRTLIALMENYQQDDGTIAIPKVLQEYVGKERITKR